MLLLGLLMVGPLAAQPLAPPASTRQMCPPPSTWPACTSCSPTKPGELVQQKVDGLRRHQPSFQARVDLADAAFPIIDRVLKAEEGVPLDFRYLALQESALQGDARSIHEAVGYWQLKQETATGLGLAVNAAVDERQHLAASTRAAARYLTRSNNATLHNWLNALLSYYTGLGGVKPYTLPTDFDATEMAITEATSPYVLMFLAQKVAFEPACGLNPKPALLLQEFPAVAGQTLEAQAAALHTEPAALATHNHWLLAAAVPADKSYTLIVPVGDVTQAAGIAANQRLQSSKELLATPAVAGNAAEVRVNELRALIALPGENVADLARRGHQRLGVFLHHNELEAFDAAVAGRPYFLENKRDAAAVEYHVLQPGETIFDVAQKYGIRQKSVCNKNRMARVEELRPGRVLWLQHTRPRETAIEYRTLPEGVALERPGSSAATTASPAANTDALLDQANAPVAIRRAEATESGQVKVKIKVKNETGKTKRVVTEEADGWGEALNTATTAAAAAPAPPIPAAPPVRPIPEPMRPASAKRTYLPPPAAAPAPAPLADEPSAADSAVATPVTKRPTTVYKPVPVVPGPLPAPAKTVAPAAPYPATVVPKPLAVPASTPVVSAIKPTGNETTHRVEAHESVSSISRLYGIPFGTLMALNHLTPPASLTIGQVLVLREPAPAAVTPAPLAKPLQASAPAPTNPPSGRVNSAALYVPKKGTASTAPAPTATAPTVLHTVIKGETLYSIAKRYQVMVADLQAWNGKTGADMSAKIGEVLRVSAGK